MKIVLLAILVVGCSNVSDPNRTAALDRQSVVLVDDVNADGWPRDFIQLDSARVTDDGLLQLFTKRGGGCGEHRAALLVSRTFAESQPPLLRARIAHDAGGDMCDALISWRLDFDLAAVRQHYQATYGARAGALILDFATRSITYTFR